MSAFLLAWNPKRWNWTELPDVLSAYEAGRSPIQRWSCGTVKQIKDGDQVFLIRLVEEPRGSFGFGTVVRGSYEDTHWEDESKKSQYVEFQIDWITSPSSRQIISREQLDEPPFLSMHWDTQMSGVRIPDDRGPLPEFREPLPEQREPLPEHREPLPEFRESLPVFRGP